MKEPLQAKAITAGWQTTGKTPHATLYAAMIREIAKKGKAADSSKRIAGFSQPIVRVEFESPKSPIKIAIGRLFAF